MKNYWLDKKKVELQQSTVIRFLPEQIKKILISDIRASLPACEWVELKGKDINEKSLAR